MAERLSQNPVWKVTMNSCPSLTDAVESLLEPISDIVRARRRAFASRCVLLFERRDAKSIANDLTLTSKLSGVVITRAVFSLLVIERKPPDLPICSPGTRAQNAASGAAKISVNLGSLRHHKKFDGNYYKNVAISYTLQTHGRSNSVFV